MLMQTERRIARILGLSLLLAGIVLAACSPDTPPDTAPDTAPGDAPAAIEQTDLPATPARATDGTLDILFWQAVSILNPYLSAGATSDE